MQIQDANGKIIALILSNADEEDDMHIFLGKLLPANEHWLFVNKERGWRLSLDSEQVSRLQPVSEDTKEMLLHADYVHFMSIGDLPEAGGDDFLNTGMKWH